MSSDRSIYGTAKTTGTFSSVSPPRCERHPYGGGTDNLLDTSDGTYSHRGQRLLFLTRGGQYNRGLCRASSGLTEHHTGAES